MREIKFRAWDGFEMIYDVVPLFANKTEKPGIIQHHFGAGFRIQIVKELLEFTGLHDKNGKEIYEGDIVKTKPINSNTWIDRKKVIHPEIPVNCYVEWYIDRWHLRPHGYRLGHYELEIVGNIYKNSELLEEK
jgi:hypothetical protein